MSKITVIGAGSVGATIANDLMIQGTASEIVLIDVNKQKAFGEAMDIYQGAPFCSPTIVRSGDYDAAAGSDIVIITSGLPRKAGQSRLELAQANINILKDITPQITAATGMVMGLWNNILSTSISLAKLQAARVAPHTTATRISFQMTRNRSENSISFREIPRMTVTLA